MRVVHVPADKVNPYSRLLAEGLSTVGIDATLWFDPPRGGNPRRLLTTLDHVDLVHWHWIDSFYRGRSRSRFLARAALFTSVMVELRLRRIPQVVTVHNLLPHERRFESWHRRMAPVIGALADRLLVHHERAIEPVASLYGARHKIRVVPHPDYHDAAVGETREALRRKWALTEYPSWAIVFGGIRRYKRIEAVVEAADMLAQRGIGLVIAGWCQDDEYRTHLLALGTGLVRFVLQPLSADELDELLIAADVVVLPYAEALSSGAAHLAVSRAKPIVCSREIAFSEFVEHGLAVEVDVTSPATLADAVMFAQVTAGETEPLRRSFREQRRPERIGALLSASYPSFGFGANRPV